VLGSREDLPAPTGSDLGRSRFAPFCTARLAAETGAPMQLVGVGWLIYSLSGSVLDLGLIGLTLFLPAFGSDIVRLATPGLPFNCRSKVISAM